MRQPFLVTFTHQPTSTKWCALMNRVSAMSAQRGAWHELKKYIRRLGVTSLREYQLKSIVRMEIRDGQATSVSKYRNQPPTSQTRPLLATLDQNSLRYQGSPHTKGNHGTACNP